MSEDATQQLLVARVDRLISMVEPISGQLGNLEKRFDNLEKRFDNLETKVDQRLRETRPIWENVQSQLTELKKEIAELRSETASGFRGVDRKIGVLSKNLVDMTADIQELRDLIEKLEPQPA